MVINNEHMLCRAIYRLLKSEISYNYVHCTQLKLTMLAYHIINAPPEARSRDLPVPRWLLYHWAMDPLLPVIFRQILFSVEVLTLLLRQPCLNNVTSLRELLTSRQIRDVFTSRHYYNRCCVIILTSGD